MTTDRERIVLEALNERYKAMAVIRERVQSVALWILGLLGAGTGWIVVQDPSWGIGERLAISSALVATLLILRLTYFRDLERGFVAQQRVAATLEDELGLYADNVLNRDGKGKALYPAEWKNAGTGTGRGQFFRSNYRLLCLGGFLLLGGLWIALFINTE